MLFFFPFVLSHSLSPFQFLPSTAAAQLLFFFCSLCVALYTLQKYIGVLNVLAEINRLLGEVCAAKAYDLASNRLVLTG
jgi:hypothetical protein